jgi:hypothetical protein
MQSKHWDIDEILAILAMMTIRIPSPTFLADLTISANQPSGSAFHIFSRHAWVKIT